MTTPNKTFQSPDLPLDELLGDVKAGKIQLPDFQREWVWDDDHVKSLLASVSMSYPIGAIMMLQADPNDMTFRPLPLAGVTIGDHQAPDHLVLDGQQRLTSLFLSLRSGVVVATRDARKNPIKRWYYIDIAKALNPNEDREEAIFGVPEDRILKDFRGEVLADYSTPEKEFAADVFPLAQILESSEWRNSYFKFWEFKKENIERFTEFDEQVIKRFEQYQVPAIVLVKETPKEAVCQVFEKVNTGGVSLTVFELLTATYAVDNFRLRDDWREREKRLRKELVLKSVLDTDFLQSITLLATRARRLQAKASGEPPEKWPGISCKRKDVLKLRLADYQRWADEVEKALMHAAKVLHSQKVFSSGDVPYRTQLVPLAAVLCVLGNKAENEGVRQKLIRWLWCGVLGELYGSATESRFAKDVAEVVAWVEGGPEPSTVSEALFRRGRLHSLRTRNSAAYKGLYALLMRDGCEDFRTGDTIERATYFDESIDIHHLFPQKWCLDNDIKPSRFNSIINKTPLSAKTNRMIGGNAPGDYLERVQKSAEIGSGRMDEIILTHAAAPELMRANDFEGFYAAREQALLDRIEKAMGKPVLGRDDAEVQEDGVDDEEADA